MALIYYQNKYFLRDIKKAIHFYSLDSDQNHPEAQYNLGFIYYDGRYVKRDIKMAIHYFALSSNQNFHQAQYVLELIYYEDKSSILNIKKGVYYKVGFKRLGTNFLKTIRSNL